MGEKSLTLSITDGTCMIDVLYLSKGGNSQEYSRVEQFLTGVYKLLHNVINVIIRTIITEQIYYTQLIKCDGLLCPGVKVIITVENKTNYDIHHIVTDEEFGCLELYSRLCGARDGECVVECPEEQRK